MNILKALLLLPLLSAGCSHHPHYEPANSSPDVSQHQIETDSVENMMLKMKAMNVAMVDDLRVAGANYDETYINLMLEHHTGAVMMAQEAVNNTTHTELRQASAEIIRTQKAEIEQLKTWRLQWYGY